MMMDDKSHRDDADSQKDARTDSAAGGGPSSRAGDESDLDSLQTMRPQSQRGNAPVPPDTSSDLDLAQTIRPTRPTESGKPAPAPNDGQLPVGYVLDGRLTVTKMHGQGAMGRVYRVIDGDTQAEFAVKVLTPSLASDPQALLELKHEVARAAPLTHQNLLSLKYFADFGPLKYIVMENIEGESLEALRIRRGGRLPVEELDRLAPQILTGLDYLHDRGIVHLDVKPQNIMVTLSGEIKITDYGIARTIREQLRRQDDLQQQLGGTLCYMAPEQIRPGVVCDRRADIYAIGMMFYYLLTGGYPFNAADTADIVKWHLDERHQLRGLPPTNYTAMITRALRVNRDERWTSCREMSQNKTCARCGAALSSSTGRCTACATQTSPSENFPSVDEGFSRLDAELVARTPKKGALGRLSPQSYKGQAAAIATCVLPVDVVALPEVLRRLDARSREEQAKIGWLLGGSRELLYQAWTQKAVESYRRLQHESETEPDLRRELNQYGDRYGSGRDKMAGHSLWWRIWNGSSALLPTGVRRVLLVGFLVNVVAGLLWFPLTSFFLKRIGNYSTNYLEKQAEQVSQHDDATGQTGKPPVQSGDATTTNEDPIVVRNSVTVDLTSTERQWSAAERKAAEKAFEIALKKGEPFGLKMNMTTKELAPSFEEFDSNDLAELAYKSSADEVVNHPDFDWIVARFIADPANPTDPGRLSWIRIGFAGSLDETARLRAATFSDWDDRLTGWFGPHVKEPRPFTSDPSAKYLSIWRRDQGAHLPSSMSQITLKSDKVAIGENVLGEYLILMVFFKNDPKRGG